MQHRSISFRDTRSFSNFFLEYIEQHPKLKPFYHRFPTVDQFKDQLAEKEKSFPLSHRQVLADVLTKQYTALNPPAAVQKNISLLKEQKTFTITTGHQLNIFTGPLYFIYKIVTVINACKKLKAAYPDYNFVPVYWMASEDHDYEEIKSFRLYGKKYTWTTEQQGAVGRFHLAEMKKLLADIPGEITIFRNAYEKSKTLAEAVRNYVNAVFGNEGLVVVDADDRSLKDLLQGVIRDDVFANRPAQVVNDATKRLQDLGYHTQVNARDINFFFLDEGVRGRLEKQGDEYIVVDTKLKFTADELERMISETPEKFSPNVILRPLYQEIILPNLAYVGGPAEVVYWLQLKGVFDLYSIPLPMLMPRNFALVVDAPTERKMEKTGLELKDYFEEKNYIFNHWVTKNSRHDLSLGKEITAIQDLFRTIQKKAAAVDATLGPYVDANAKKINDRLEHIEKKIFKAEKKLHSDRLRQIEAVKDTLFPGGGLQERVDNFLNFQQQDPGFVQRLIECFDPFAFHFNVLSYE